MTDRAETPAYYAIIPASVRYDKKVPANARLLFGEITALANSTGACFARNAYFADLYDVTADTISVWISTLRKRGHISVEMQYEDGTRQIIGRKIFIGAPTVVFDGSPAVILSGRPTVENDGYNITNLNTGEMGRPGTVWDREGTVMVVDSVAEKLDETLMWLQGKKRLKHMPPQEWLTLFDELALNGIDLDGFRDFYEWCEALDWRNGAMSTKLLRGQVETYLNRDKIMEKAAAGKGDKNGKLSNAELLEQYK